MFNTYAATLPTDAPTGVVTIGSFETLFSNFLGIAISVAGIILFGMLIKGGFDWLSAGGEAGKVQTAQKTLTWAIGGLVFIVMSFIIVRLIASFTGVEGILNFQIVQP